MISVSDLMDGRDEQQSHLLELDNHTIRVGRKNVRSTTVLETNYCILLVLTTFYYDA